MWRQLTTAVQTANGRGLALVIHNGRCHVITDPEFGHVERQDVLLGVSAVGPGNWANLEAFVVKADGTVVTKLWSEARFDATSDDLEERLTFGKREIADLYLLVMWQRPYGKGLRTEAIRGRIHRRNDRSDIEQFCWWTAHQLLAWVQDLPWVPAFRLGHWKPLRLHQYGPQQLPGLPDGAPLRDS